jgi:hypothetical protein
VPKVRVYTNADIGDLGHVPVQGTRVMVGELLLENVVALVLHGDPMHGVWRLQIDVHVDPATVFIPLPPPHGRKLADG